MMRRPWSAPALGLGIAVSAGVACYGATQVELEITTDLPCVPVSPRTAIRLGEGATDTNNVVADTTTCTDEGASGARVGSIVLVPSGDRDARVAVEVALTADGSDPDLCRPDANGALPNVCVVARRSFAFIPHTSRTLPIRLYAACRGKVCAPTETCGKTGACESAEVSPDQGCIASECNDGTPDGAPPPHDDGGSDVVTIDAARLSCTAPDGTSSLTHVEESTDTLVANSSHVFWTAPSLTLGAMPGAQMLRTIATKQADVPRTVVDSTEGEIHTIAADEHGVWFAEEKGLYHADVPSMVITHWPLDYVNAIFIPPPAPAATNTVVYALTAQGLFTINPAVPEETPTQLVGAVGGTHLELVPTAAFVFDGPDVATGGLLHRYPLPWHDDFPVQQPIAVDPVSGTAAFGSTLYFIAGKGALKMYRWNDPIDLAPVSFSSFTVPTGAGPFAVDAQYIYMAERNSNANGLGIIRAHADDSPSLSPIPPVKQGIFDDVRSPAIDAKCVYFWSSSATLQSLSVYPKEPR